VASEGPATVEPGVHGLGNHPMSAPFRKTEKGLEAFRELVRDWNRVEAGAELEKKLFDMMADAECTLPDDQMELQGSQSAFRSFHAQLSGLFVDLPQHKYGTRMQTVVLVDFDLNVTFVERTRVSGGTQDWSEKRFQFKFQD
jgi:uncharacterized protein with NRDE domain